MPRRIPDNQKPPRIGPINPGKGRAEAGQRAPVIGEGDEHGEHGVDDDEFERHSGDNDRPPRYFKCY